MSNNRPGSLSKLISQVSTFQANVVNINHERAQMASFGAARVQMTLDVRGPSHIDDIISSLNLMYKDSGGVRMD